MTKNHAKGLSVGIIGGSIAGCAAAIALSRAGCEVIVLEGRGEEPKDRSAGVGLPPSLVATLLERDLIDADLPRFDVHRLLHVARDEDERRNGRLLWEQPGSLSLVNWGALYRSLRRRVPERAYLGGCRVVALRPGERSVAVELEGGEVRSFDLLVCADGHGSIGRRTLFPDRPVHYCGSLLWRGAVAESALADVVPLEGAECWPCYRGGYGPFYLVPGPGGETSPGRRVVDWGLYLSVHETDRAELVTGKDPPAYAEPLPAAREGRLKAWVHDVLPELYAEIVEKSAGTSAQLVREGAVPAYAWGRTCLVGDAGALARPHTGTGLMKGITDALTLAETLARDSSLEAALERWSDERTTFGNALVRLATQVGNALATEIPSGPSDRNPDWFKTLVTVPSEVFGRVA